jgi:NitT/TauT family transport system substrate-binding protein
VGTTQTAMSAFERGDIDALSLFDPIMNDLEQKGTVKIMADARDTAGTQEIFGGPYASGSLYADAAWLAKNNDACRGAALAIKEAVTFLKGATPEAAIAALEKGMCFVGANVCTGAFVRNRGAFEHNNAVTPEMAATVLRMLASFSPEIAAAKIDLAGTYTNQFVGA